MKVNRCLLFSCIFLIFTSITVVSQTEPQKLSGVRTVAEPTTPLYNPPPFIDMDLWKGKKFFFMPGPKAAKGSNYDNFSGNISRKNYQGRIATVVNLENFSGMWHFVFEMDDTKEQLKAKTETIVVGIALKADVDFAREQWMGKTFWCKEASMSVYNEATDIVEIKQIKRHSSVKILDVIPGWNEIRPIRLMLETADGDKGFVDINVSGTNVPEEFKVGNSFEEFFNFDDPRKLYNWPADIWKLIESAQIIDGMNKEQVVMSWGEPAKMTSVKGGEEWHYPATILKFKGDILAGIR